MKILISDYPESMMPYHDIEIARLKELLGDDIDIEIYDYSDDRVDEFCDKLADADALITAFIPLPEAVLRKAKKLKSISINATGYDNVDLDVATELGIGVSPVGEYCTWDVAEMALALTFALNKQLKHYIEDIDVKHVWDYADIAATPRLEEQTVGIFGFGKIGRCTAKKIGPLVKKVLAVDPYADYEAADQLGVELVEAEEIFKHCDVIINHMNLNASNKDFFNKSRFDLCEKKPIFINLGRGLCVNEDDLVQALDEGQIRACGLDVLQDETPDLAHHKLVGRENVIITPHCAFYSITSLEDLMRFSAQNAAYMLRGEKEKVFKLVNEV